MAQNGHGDDDTKRPAVNKWRFAGIESYQDDDGVVVADTQNSRAWLRSDVTVEIRQ